MSVFLAISLFMLGAQHSLGPSFGKCISKEAPRYIEEFFKVRVCNYNLRGSGTLLMVPSFNLEWPRKSFSFLAAKLWNLICYLPMLEMPRIFLL